MGEEAIVEGVRDLGFVAGDDPGGLEQLLLLLFEDRLVGIDTRVDVMRRRKLRRCIPIGA